MEETKERKADRRRIGAALRELRKAAGLTQEEAALRLGLTRARLSLLETGRENATLDRVGRYAALLGARLELVPVLEDEPLTKS